MRPLRSILLDLATPVISVAAFATLIACAQGPTPNKRFPLHDPDPRCPAELAQIVPEAVVPRAEIDRIAANHGLPAGYGRGASGLYLRLERRILIADDMQGWRLRHVQQWERCRAWLHRETGSSLMAHELRALGLGAGGRT